MAPDGSYQILRRFVDSTNATDPLTNNESLVSTKDAGSHAATSRMISAVIGSVVPIVALAYLAGFFVILRHARRHPRPLNKHSGVLIQKCGPFAYVFVVCVSLVELAMSIWLLAQYNIHHNQPNEKLLVGIRLLLFCSCWTLITAAAYSILFTHPVWSTYTISSLGVQLVWILCTWIFWIAGAAITNNAMPFLTSTWYCGNSLVYCEQIQGLYAMAVLEIVTLTGALLTLVYLVWALAR